MKTFGRTTLGVIGALAIALLPTLVFGDDAAAAAPTPNKGDTAWMLTSTALVLLMSVPALGLFYGGLVRSKNMLSVLMQVFVGFSLVTVLWCVYGYSLAFTAGNPFFGGLSRLFLNGTFDPVKGAFSYAATFSKATPMYELVFVAFQATFAAITCCLILGSIVERIKFSGVLLFIVIWFTFSYLPVAHMVWYLGRPGRVHECGSGRHGERRRGLDLAVGRAGLRGRHGRAHQRRVSRASSARSCSVSASASAKKSMRPHSLTMTMIGASLLWFGWFGFNAGSALEANGSAALAFMNTYLATACAVLSWMFVEWIVKGKPSMLGAASGAVAGLVAITPAAGNVGIPGAFVIGLGVGVVCLWGCTGLKKMIGADDSLDVFGVHALGGMFGALMTGIFNAPSLGGPGLVTDWVMGTVGYPGRLAQFIIQAKAVGLVFVWTAVVAFISFQIVEVHRRAPCVRGARARRSRHHGSRRARVHELVHALAGWSLRPATFTGCRPFLLAASARGVWLRGAGRRRSRARGRSRSRSAR